MMTLCATGARDAVEDCAKSRMFEPLDVLQLVVVSAARSSHMLARVRDVWARAPCRALRSRASASRSLSR
eukprot:1650454-Pleurochrysis_carterae.AAC.1